jgi:hypothetical protein
MFYICFNNHARHTLTGRVCRHFLLSSLPAIRRVNQMTPKLFYQIGFFLLSQQLLLTA